MHIPYAFAIWQSHVAPAAAAAAAAAAYVLRWNYKTFSGNLTLKNDMFDLRNCMFLIKKSNLFCLHGCRNLPNRTESEIF